ncbi:MAG: hypothetical protein H7067_14505 [Burkholderiales bacterium]|nr:hypothetical protein [Opitutaceae bacterium]
MRTHDVASGNLYGVREAKDQPSVIVFSSDSGVTWRDVFTTKERVTDLAVDSKNGRIYLAVTSRLLVWEKATGAVTELKGFARDPEGAPRIQSVAVDPVDPSVIYIAGGRNTFASNASAQRSLDGGVTWTNLAVNTPLDGKVLDGGRESLWVRVNSKTREAWFATSCYGIWKYAPPTAAVPTAANEAK